MPRKSLMNLTNLGRVIVDLCEKQNETYASMAKRLKISPMMLWNICHGERRPGTNLLPNIIKEYDLTLEEKTRLRTALYNDIIQETAEELNKKFEIYILPMFDD